MAPSPVSIAVLGAPGLIGVRHTQHVIDEPSTVLACIVDPTPVGPKFAADRGVPCFPSLDALLAARAAGTIQVDGAILATPNATHVPLGVQLMKAGVHALVEKPMSTDISSGRILVAAAEASTADVLVGQHRRFNPYIVNLKKMLNEGALGKVLAVSGQWATLKPLDYFESPTEWRKAAGTGGVILINLVHDIDLMRFLFGDIVRVYCEEGISTRGHPVEETGALTMKFASGMVGTFIFTDAAASPYNMESATGENPLFPHKGQNTYCIMGTKGSTSFPELKRWHYEKDDGCWTDDLKAEPATQVDDIPPFTRQLRNFVEVCRGTAEPNTSALEGLKTILTLEAIRESISTGKPVEVAQK